MKNLSKEYDQFYTKKEVAKECIDIAKKIIPASFFSFLEPSAGDGAFVDGLSPFPVQACDIDPKREDIEKKDFLSSFWTAKTVIGNPPFGVQSKMAVSFFNHAANFASFIAFIVPISWEKWSIHKRLNPHFRLIESIRLDPDSFIFENEPYKVKCVFQIWTKEQGIGEDKRIRKAPITSHPDFDFLPKSALKNADFLMVVCGARSSLFREITTDISPATVERIKMHDPKVRERLEKVDWKKYFNSNTGTMWINRETIVKEYSQIKNILLNN